MCVTPITSSTYIAFQFTRAASGSISVTTIFLRLSISLWSISVWSSWNKWVLLHILPNSLLKILNSLRILTLGLLQHLLRKNWIKWLTFSRTWEPLHWDKTSRKTQDLLFSVRHTQIAKSYLHVVTSLITLSKSPRPMRSPEIRCCFGGKSRKESGSCRKNRSETQDTLSWSGRCQREPKKLYLTGNISY